MAELLFYACFLAVLPFASTDCTFQGKSTVAKATTSKNTYEAPPVIPTDDVVKKLWSKVNGLTTQLADLGTPGITGSVKLTVSVNAPMEELPKYTATEDLPGSSTTKCLIKMENLKASASVKVVSSDALANCFGVSGTSQQEVSLKIDDSITLTVPTMRGTGRITNFCCGSELGVPDTGAGAQMTPAQLKTCKDFMMAIYAKLQAKTADVAIKWAREAWK